MTVPIHSQLPYQTLYDSFDRKGWGEYEFTVYYPDDRDQAPYPAIIFAHGFLSHHKWSTWVETLASEGYIVITFTVPNRAAPDVEQWVQGIEGCIDYLETKNDQRSWWWRRSSPLYNLVDLNRIAVIGHSMGGMAALTSAANNPEIDTIIVIGAPYYNDVETDNEVIEPILNSIDWERVYTSAHEITIPVQFQVGTLDKLAYEHARTYYDVCQGEKELIEIVGGNHINYIDPIKASDAALELVDLVFFDLPDDIQEILLTSMGIDVGLLNILEWLPKSWRLSILNRYIPELLEAAGVADLTLIDFVLGTGLDNEATMTPQEQQEVSLNHIIDWLTLFLID